MSEEDEEKSGNHEAIIENNLLVAGIEPNPGPTGKEDDQVQPMSSIIYTHRPCPTLNCLRGGDHEPLHGDWKKFPIKDQFHIWLWGMLFFSSSNANFRPFINV